MRSTQIIDKIGIIRIQESATFAANYVITQDGSPRFLQLNIPGIFELIAWRNNSSHLGGGAEGIQIKIVLTGKTKYTKIKVEEA